MLYINFTCGLASCNQFTHDLTLNKKNERMLITNIVYNTDHTQFLIKT